MLSTVDRVGGGVNCGTSIRTSRVVVGGNGLEVIGADDVGVV